MNVDSKISPKVSGYLEKKGKMKMMNSYKKYWFVLEGRLLLYYRSKDEYEAISPCKGSINLGPPCNVKPCSSTHGIFQIETRSTTITLRAENQDDQNRWMQGIISALNQNKNSTKLGHFRYSLSELPQEHVTKGKLKRQNSIPSTDSPQNQLNKEILQRLQKIGAQSYGETMDMRNRMKCLQSNIYERVSTDSTNGSENFSYHTHNKKTEETETSNLPNTPVSWENNVFLRKIDQDAETLNRPSTFLLENEVYATSKHITTLQCRKENRSDTIAARPSTFLLENEVYASTNTITTQKNKDNINRESNLILENRHYHSANKQNIPNRSSEHIYSEPKCTELTDHNENNVLLNNGHHVGNGEVNAYSVFELYNSDSNKNIGTTNGTSGYEYLQIGEYAELEDRDNVGTNECLAKSKPPTIKKGKKKKVKKVKKTDADDKEIKIKKSSSFIKRVWKRKPKHKEAAKNEENLYETVAASVVDKVCINDDTAIQMLSELHNILENKKPILSERLSTDCKYTGEKIEAKKATSRENVNNASPNSSTNDETAVQMLTELQNILQNKKNILTARMSNDNDERKTDEVKTEKKMVQSKTEENNSNDVESASTSSETEIVCPVVPPKNKKIIESPYHNFPKNNQPINIRLPPKKKRNLENVKSLDEILDDLEMQEIESSSKNKVKKLIERFSDSDFNEDDVVLRTNKRIDNYCREDIDSDELNRLLNDLAKVTCAPILTPGVTTSLINPNLMDEELLKLVPKHHRRYSEPDYDIPRPHKYLTNLPKKETPADSVIESTRFFGPILKPSDINIKSNNIKTPSEDIPSMTPDSLEIEAQATYPHSFYLSEDEKNYSYTSHNYGKFKNYNSSTIRTKDDLYKNNITANIENSTKRFDNIIENDISAQPKPLHDINEVKGYKMKGTHINFKYLDIEFDEENAKELFVDSLET